MITMEWSLSTTIVVGHFCQFGVDDGDFMMGSIDFDDGWRCSWMPQ